MSWTAVCPRCTRTFVNELGRPKECETCVMSEAESLAVMDEADAELCGKRHAQQTQEHFRSKCQAAFLASPIMKEDAGLGIWHNESEKLIKAAREYKIRHSRRYRLCQSISAIWARRVRLGSTAKKPKARRIITTSSAASASASASAAMASASACLSLISIVFLLLALALFLFIFALFVFLLLAFLSVFLVAIPI